MRCARDSLLLYAVTDRSWTGRQTLLQQVEAALKGGVTCVQLREKSLNRDAFLSEAQSIARLCARYQVPFIVNDDVDIAMTSGAQGIHVGQEDMHPALVRQQVGEGMIVGVSVQTVAEARQAADSGADYLGVGAIFPTATKQDAALVDKDELAAICAAVPIPVVAIGGITRDNLRELSGTGVAGVALVSAIFAAQDISGACRTLCQLTQRMVQGAGAE